MAKNVPAVKEEAGALAVIDFSADAGSGFEDASASAYAIPFLRVLQAISPQCKKMDPDYVQGAEEGDFFNTVTRKLYKGDMGVKVVPCHFVIRYNEWAPNRGGFRGAHTEAEYARLEKTKAKDAKGNEFVANAETGNSLDECREHYVLILDDDGTCAPALLALSGGNRKRSKNFMSMLKAICGDKKPSYSQVFRLLPTPESNDKGSWAGIKIEHHSQIADIHAYQAAKAFHEMVRSGAVKATPADGEEMPF